MPSTSPRPRPVVPRRLPLVGTALFASLFALSACAGGAGESASSTTPAGSPAAGHQHGEGAEAESAVPRLAITHDGGIFIVDAASGEVEADLALDGFNRVNPAGDGRHVLVSTAGGFQVLDAGAWSEAHGDHSHHYTADPVLEELVFPAEKPGHVVRHAGQAVLFDDGTGKVGVFDPTKLGGDSLPVVHGYQTPEAHHGVAVQLDNGHLVVTEGTEETRTGIKLLGEAADDGTREVLKASDECPGVHGEATARGEAVVVGCEDGLLVVKDGDIAKIESPDSYGRIGNQAGSEASTVVLGDYKKDKDAELERPRAFSLTDTATNELQLVETDYSYSFRSLGRGAQGEALVFGTDGTLHIHDASTGRETGSVEVTGAWTEPIDWQKPRPALFVQDGTAYVSEPSAQKIHVIDLASEQVTGSFDLPGVPNELTGISG